VIRAGATPPANRFDVNADLNGISIGPLLKDVANKDLLEGRGNLKLVLNAAGGTVDAIKRGLDGSAALNLRDGAIKGINLGETIRSTRNLLQGGGKAETKASDAGKKTDFTEMNVSFVIADGIASSNDLDVKSPLLRLGGEGRADLVAGRLDYTVRASVVGTSTGQGGKDLAEVRGVTIPVRLTGPFEQLAWQIDWETAGKEALKSRASAEIKERLKIDDIEGKAKEKLGESLKGLFKR
jgi:AsmA protein